MSSVISRGNWDQRAKVDGRTVKLTCRAAQDGLQSINICSAANKAGDYEEVQYLKTGYTMTVDEVARFADLASLKAELRRRVYRQSN